MRKMMSPEYKFLVGGQWKSSDEPVEIRSPYSGEVVGVTYQASSRDVEAAVESSGRAFQETRRLPTYSRAQILENIAQSLKKEKEPIARLISLEAGKPIKQARVEASRAAFT